MRITPRKVSVEVIPQPQTRVMRVIQGQPIPANYEFVQWLGVETDIIYGPGFKADVLLVRERKP